MWMISFHSNKRSMWQGGASNRDKDLKKASLRNKYRHISHPFHPLPERYVLEADVGKIKKRRGRGSGRGKD